MKIKRGDMVVVVSGDDKSSTPRLVQSVQADGSKVVVEGVNLVYKHVKRGHPKSPQGGRLRLEKPISSANVQFYCGTCSQGVKLGYRYLADGSKERFCRKCEKSAGQTSPARARYAAK
ncbi:50S ribosomal protein L24 [Planctomicrobium sp. SH668]|uniref:50S ribosomal protein L24 n=1 Tax=Planctomicrobium sp. SH668 TaxID=3448126 RepID=UPI003F5C77A9